MEGIWPPCHSPPPCTQRVSCSGLLDCFSSTLPLAEVSLRVGLSDQFILLPGDLASRNLPVYREEMQEYWKRENWRTEKRM